MDEAQYKKDFEKLSKELKKAKKSKKKKASKGPTHKLLSKPKVSIQKYSAVAAVSKIAAETGPVVKEGPTGYFQKELMEEKRKWLR